VSDNISAIIAEIICVMIEWLIDKNCPNYFIPENNMLDHLTVDHSFSKEVDFLSDYLDEERLIPFIIHVDVIKVSATCSDLKFDTLHYTNVSNISRYLPFWGEKQPDEIEIVEFVEFELLHTALKLQVELRRSSRGIGISKMTVDSEDTTEEILLMAVVQDHRTSSSLDMLRFRVEALLFFRTSNIIELRFLSSRRTLFICVAYLANFYYVTKSDYERSRRLCRKLFECIAHCCYEGILDNIMISRGNIAIAELSFPVLLSTEWLDLFDEDIQTVVGFVMLYGFHANDHNCCSDAIKICPVLFLHYINAQCEMHLGTEGKSLKKALNGFRVHFKRICPSDLHPWDVSVDQRKLRAMVLCSALDLRRRFLRLLET